VISVAMQRVDNDTFWKFLLLMFVNHLDCLLIREVLVEAIDRAVETSGITLTVMGPFFFIFVHLSGKLCEIGPALFVANLPFSPFHFRISNRTCPPDNLLSLSIYVLRHILSPDAARLPFRRPLFGVVQDACACATCGPNTKLYAHAHLLMASEISSSICAAWAAAWSITS
jgi:hypothetical protein